MSAPSRIPVGRRLAFAVAIWGLVVAALVAASFAEAKAKETANLCVTMAGPEKGNVRFTSGLTCKRGELSVPVLTRAGRQGPSAVEEGSGQSAGASAQGATARRAEPGTRGPQGRAGSDGADGRGVLSGRGAPNAGTGSVGDFYIDTASYDIFGPKLAEDWSDGVSLIGPQGDRGPIGPEGPRGPQGDPGLGTPAIASTAASGTRDSDSYGELSGGGDNPAVTLTTGTRAMVTVTGYLDPSASSSAFIGYSVSGATTEAASDERAVIRERPSSASVGGLQASTTSVIDDLAPGTNTFTLEYKGSGSFANRTITVVPLG
jgi:hypothetical protein